MLIFAGQVIFSFLSKATEHLEEVTTSQLLSSPFFLLMLRNGKKLLSYVEDLIYMNINCSIESPLQRYFVLFRIMTKSW